MLLRYVALLLALCAGRLPAQPTWTLGKAPIEIRQEFGDITDAIRLLNGNLAVVDNGYLNVSFFDPAGKRLGSFGREGKGPGEFQYLVLLGECAPGVVSVYDPNNARVTNLSAAGTFLASQPSLSTFGRMPYKASCSTRGRMLVIDPPANYLTPALVEGAYRDSASIRIDKTSLGSFPGDERWLWIIRKDRPTGAPRPGGKRLLAALGTDRIFVSPSDSFSVAVFDVAGRPVGSFTHRAPAKRITPRDRAKFVEDEAESRNIPLPLAQRMIGTALPDVLPPISRFVTDGDTLWVQLSRNSTDATVTWLRFDERGALLNTLTVPQGFHIFRFYGPTALGRWTDSELAGSIRYYRLEATQ